MANVSEIPYKDIANAELPNVIKKHFGNDSKLESWKSIHFMEEGNNYLGKVLAIICKISHSDTVSEEHFIVKLNPRRSLELFKRMTLSFFIKEGNFLSFVGPQLDEILTSSKHAPLSLPECYYVNLEKNNEIILLRDLRRDGYKMHSRLQCLDEKHVILVLRELAKLHASSWILLSKSSDEAVLRELSYMKDLWLHKENPGAIQYIAYCNTRFSGAVHSFKEVPGYEKVQKWLEKEETNLFEYFVEDWERYSPQFRTICHGDVWNNNMLYKYGVNGDPVSVALIDFQQCRLASPVTDIIIFLMTTSHWEDRKHKINFLLQTYYETFAAIMFASKVPVPFTLDELKTEYFDKMRFGFLCGIIRLPLTLVENDDVYNFDSLDGETFARFLEFQKKQAWKILHGNAIGRNRFLSIFDDALDKGFFD